MAARLLKAIPAHTSSRAGEVHKETVTLIHLANRRDIMTHLLSKSIDSLLTYNMVLYWNDTQWCYLSNHCSNGTTKFFYYFFVFVKLFKPYRIDKWVLYSSNRNRRESDDLAPAWKKENKNNSRSTNIEEIVKICIKQTEFV